jgi:hypothetical protein
MIGFRLHNYELGHFIIPGGEFFHFFDYRGVDKGDIKKGRLLKRDGPENIAVARFTLYEMNSDRLINGQ